MFSNKPWKEWKTRKATLIFSVCCVCAYTVVGVVMGFLDHSLDGTLTEQVFGFFKWLVLTGCAITISKVIKGKTNSDCDEYISDDEDLNYTDETNNYTEETNVSYEVNGKAIDTDNETADNVIGRKID